MWAECSARSRLKKQAGRRARCSMLD
jgi:hypothetical protein